MYTERYLDRIWAEGSIRDLIAGRIWIEKIRSDKEYIATGGERVFIGIIDDVGVSWVAEEWEVALIIEIIVSSSAAEPLEVEIDDSESTVEISTGAFRW
jgi:hypothetical protein